DAVSKKIRNLTDHWRETQSCTDHEVAEMMRRDGLHMVVHLGGVFDNNRPLVSCHHPAPLQVSFHAGSTNGLHEIDYWMSDGVLHPPEETRERFREKLYRLPVFYNYFPRDYAPPVEPFPEQSQTNITFICLNNPVKINPHVVRLWSQILARTPGSNLILKYRKHMDVEQHRARFIEAFQSQGIEPERIRLIQGVLTDHSEHLALYHQADIALDPFPFTGATTTFEALWMGVPVVSRLGDSFISRMGGSILIHAGLDELVARTDQDYVAFAVELAQNRPRLKMFRETLRKRMKESPLCDGQGYAKRVERAYLEMWSERPGLTPQARNG
ncbi:MAG: hypothetical protein HQL53_11240, partial [Magnetococcales bacterium]|nr:hypothetical protein [Magnetococcales bacterium]